MAGDDAAVSQEEAVAAAPMLGEIPSNGGEPEELEPERKAEAAIAEAEGRRKTVDLKVGETEVTLTLPENFRASALARWSVLRDDDVIGALKVLRSVIGGPNYDRMMDVLDDEEVDADSEQFGTIIGNMTQDAITAYGLTPGEVEASPDS